MIGDGELFDELRSDMPALEPARGAWRRGEVSEARRLLARHFRERQAPVFPLEQSMVRLHQRWGAANPRSAARTPEQIRREADDILAHHFVGVYGIPQTFGPEIDWFADPTGKDGITFQREWIWQFHRHSYWVTLVKAYELDQNQAYMRELAAQVRSWVTHCPRPADSGNYLFSAWRTIETGIRAANTWPYVFCSALHSEAFDDDAVLAMVKAFLEHGRHVLRWTRRFNWKTMEANGLFHVGVLFPEFIESGVFASTAIDRLYAELDAQVYPDGMQMELSPSYHQVSLINFVAPVYLAEANDYELPREYRAKLARMFEYNLLARMPDGSVPPFQDSNHYYVDGVLAEAAALLPDHRDFQWAASGRDPRLAPTRVSWAFPYSGYLVMRSGWGENDHALQFDVGPFGAGHQHEDKLNVVCHLDGRPFLVEGGCPRYEDSPWATYFRGTAAHNSVLVNGQGQNRRRLITQATGAGGTAPSVLVVKDPLPHVWEDGDQLSFGCARYDQGYGPDGAIAATHTRAVLFVKPRYWIVCDWVDLPDGAEPHRCELLWHLAANPVEVRVNYDETDQPLGARLSTNGGGLFMIHGDGLNVESRLVVGEEHPAIQGWVSDPRDHSPVPAATSTHTWDARTGGWVLSLVAPISVAEKIAACEAVPAADGMAHLQITWTDRSSDSVILRGDFGALPVGDGWAAWRRGDGAWMVVGAQE